MNLYTFQLLHFPQNPILNNTIWLGSLLQPHPTNDGVQYSREAQRQPHDTQDVYIYTAHVPLPPVHLLRFDPAHLHLTTVSLCGSGPAQSSGFGGPGMNPSH